jgi:hypothetical protein
MFTVPIIERKFIISSALRHWVYLERAFKILKAFEKLVPSHRTVISKSRGKKTRVYFADPTNIYNGNNYNADQYKRVQHHATSTSLLKIIKMFGGVSMGF